MKQNKKNGAVLKKHSKKDKTVLGLSLVLGEPKYKKDKVVSNNIISVSEENSNIFTKEKITQIIKTASGKKSKIPYLTKHTLVALESGKAAKITGNHRGILKGKYAVLL